MNVRFDQVDLCEIRDAVQQRLEALPQPVDSFLEDHILESTHYRVLIDAAPAGLASIHRANLITQFFLADPYQRWGQMVFQQLRRWENVAAALVPTCDEFFLAHALDDYRQLAKQAYFFTTGRAPADPALTAGYSLRQAAPQDASFIEQQSGGFFKNLEQQIQVGEIFRVEREGRQVGFGVRVRSKFYRDVASIGMYTIEPYRHSGAGTAAIALLIEECARHGLRAVAGCWYYNHASKRTLERAGMVTRTRLLRIEF